MTFSTRKMIAAIILVGILLALFLGFAFDSIHKVNTSFEIIRDGGIPPELAAVADAVIQNHSVPYVDGITLDGVGMDILLVNHQIQAACLIQNQKKLAVNYETLDTTIQHCNQYRLIANGLDTVIINCDEILGDPVVRAIAHAYHYAFTSTAMLNPSSIDYFPSVNQNETISFYRYAMIESAKQCYFNDAALNDFYYFYDQWTHDQGLNTYQEVILYDYYDGFYAYVKAKVLQGVDPSFDLAEYIDQYQNDYGIYAKDKEPEVMGMLWCFLREKQGKTVVVDQGDVKDIYRMLLDRTPLGQAESNAMKASYHQAFTAYIAFIADIIDQHKNDRQTMKSFIPSLTAETYTDTIHVEDNDYIYLDYTARNSNNDLLTLNAVLVEVSPYSIALFADTD